MSLTYSKYLKIDELLRLQVPLSEGEHDETLFIVIHQVYELWFKQILHEITLLQSSLEQGHQAQVLATLKRILTILKVMVAQIDILETMTPLSFASFRERLESSSGFQSVQFRLFEIVLGKKSPRYLESYSKDSDDFKKLQKAMTAPSLYDSFLKYLKLLGQKVPESILKRNYSEILESNEEIQDILLQVYYKDPATAQICERLVDLDEGVQEWRYRHVKMVERTIGTKIGTGGSSGAEYLKKTLFQPLFPDLWLIRSRF